MLNVNYLDAGRIKVISGLYVFLLMFFSATVDGQSFTVTGTITDETGEFLAGASVLVKSTGYGTISDAEGKYSLNQVTNGSVLQFSFVGHSTREITVGDEHVINVVLNSGIYLDEVIITGLKDIHDKNVLDQQRQIVKSVSDDDEFFKQFSYQMIYLFSKFTYGYVYYKGLRKSAGKLNYNILLGEMQFEENEQLLAMDNLNDVLFVEINDRKFYHFQGDEFVEEIFSTGKYKLQLRYRGKLATYGKETGYGGISPGASVATASSINLRKFSNYEYGYPSAGNLTGIPEQKEDLIISIDYFYYLVSLNGRYNLIKNINTFKKHFPKYKTQIEFYMKEHRVRFNNREDLIQLLEYCDQLSTE